MPAEALNGHATDLPVVEEPADDGIDTEAPDSLLGRLGYWLRNVAPATWLVLLLVAIYVAYFTNRTLDIHHGLGTSSYDSGLYDQGLWLMSRFEEPFVTLMGRNLFGDHTFFLDRSGLVALPSQA